MADDERPREPDDDTPERPGDQPAAPVAVARQDPDAVGPGRPPTERDRRDGGRVAGPEPATPAEPVVRPGRLVEADGTTSGTGAEASVPPAGASPAETSSGPGAETSPGTSESEPTAAVKVDAPAGQLLPGDPHQDPLPPRTLARGRLRRAMRPHATRAQLLAGALCALLGFALVVQARQTQVQGLESLRQADLVRVLDNVTNAEARAEQDVRDEQAIRDRLMSGTDSSAAAQEAAKRRLETLGLLAGTVPATGPGIELEITDPRRQVDASILLDTLEELRDGGAEVVQIGPVRVVAATAFTDEADGVRVGGRLLTPPYTYTVIGDPQTLSRLLQIPGGVLDVLHSKGAQGTVTQPPTVTVDALQAPSPPQYARPAPGATP